MNDGPSSEHFVRIRVNMNTNASGNEIDFANDYRSGVCSVNEDAKMCPGFEDPSILWMEADEDL
jgi:hypothetical protein